MTDPTTTTPERIVPVPESLLRRVAEYIAANPCAQPVGIAFALVAELQAATNAAADPPPDGGASG